MRKVGVAISSPEALGDPADDAADPAGLAGPELRALGFQEDFRRLVGRGRDELGSQTVLARKERAGRDRERKPQCSGRSTGRPPTFTASADSWWTKAWAIARVALVVHCAFVLEQGGGQTLSTASVRASGVSAPSGYVRSIIGMEWRIRVR